MSTKLLFIIGGILIVAAGLLFWWSDWTKPTPAGIQLGLNLELWSKITVAAGIICWILGFAVGRGDNTSNKQ